MGHMGIRHGANVGRKSWMWWSEGSERPVVDRSDLGNRLHLVLLPSEERKVIANRADNR